MKLQMSTATHLETDGKIERVNRVFEDVLRVMRLHLRIGVQTLPLAEFAPNNAVHATTGLMPLYVNSARHPRVSILLAVGRPTASHAFILGGKEGNKYR